ncbi:MAG: hypothetical protein HY820_16755 [Acidobacteria bacterium]|nr:hypothetical protein [Acidobacteriota bacterium]
MRRFRALFTVLLGLLLLFDGVTAFRVWWYGLKYVSIMDGRLSVESVPFTGTDWVVLLLLVSLHAALIYAVWKAWHSGPVRV